MLIRIWNWKLLRYFGIEFMIPHLIAKNSQPWVTTSSKHLKISNDSKPFLLCLNLWFIKMVFKKPSEFQNVRETCAKMIVSANNCLLGHLGADCCNVDSTHLVIFLTGSRSKFDRIFWYNFPVSDCFWSMCSISMSYLPILQKTSIAHRSIWTQMIHLKWFIIMINDKYCPVYADRTDGQVALKNVDKIACILILCFFLIYKPVLNLIWMN